jgi:hypothetical protein
LVESGQTAAADAALATARDLCPTLVMSTDPAGLPVSFDFSAQGDAPATFSPLASIYDVSVKQLPLAGATTVDLRSDPGAVVLNPATLAATVDLSTLVVGTTVNNALAASQQYAIDVADLLSTLWFIESGAIGEGDLAAQHLAFTSRSGFFGAEGELLSVSIASASPNLAVTKAAATGGVGDTQVTFTTPADYPAYPQRRDVSLLVNWQSARATGSFTLRFLPPPPSPPINEGFEVATMEELPDFWTFNSTTGTITLSTSSPHAGNRALVMEDTVDRGSDTAWQEAVLRADLSDPAKRILDFYVREHSGTGSTAELAVSVDGNTWQTVYTIPGTTFYEHCAADLDTLGLALDDEVFIRFRHHSRYQGGFTWDDIRIGGDRGVFGPKVTDTLALRSGGSTGPVTGIRVTFNEPINPATFTTYDVTVIASGGNPVSLAGNPIDSGDHITFTIPFAAAQPSLGAYSILVGPNLTDEAGNRMDQDQNGIAGDRSRPFSPSDISPTAGGLRAGIRR